MLISWIKHHRVWSILILLVVILILFFIIGGNGDEGEIDTEIVTRGDVIQIVEESGVVRSPLESELSFDQVGIIENISVKKGDKVNKGQVIAELEKREQQASLLIAEASLKRERAVFADLLRNFGGQNVSGSQREKIEIQQNANIEQAYTNLLNNDLKAYPYESPENADESAPVVSGTYIGGQEGQYIIEVYSSGADSGASIKLTGMEEGIYSASVNFPAKMGESGLFLQFPDGPKPNTKWVVDIPNKRSSTYNIVLNAYESALTGQGVALAQVETNESQIEAQQAVIEQALAQVESAKARVEKRILRAPFSGVITQVDKSAGESATGVIVSLVSNENFEITVDIPEVDISNVDNGDKTIITFDAFSDEIFNGTVFFISPSAKIVNGVSVFEVTVVFDELDPRLRSGLSVDVEIIAEEREKVLRVPSRAVVERSQGELFVRKLEYGEIVEVDVSVGLRGSDGLIEVLSGLSGGEEIITFITREGLLELDGQ